MAPQLAAALLPPSAGLLCLEGVSLGPWVCFFLHFSRNAVSVEISPLETFPLQGLSHQRLPTNELGAVAQAENSKASVQASETNESASEIPSVSICSPCRLKKKGKEKPYGSGWNHALKKQQKSSLLFRGWRLRNRSLYSTDDTSAAHPTFLCVDALSLPRKPDQGPSGEKRHCFFCTPHLST